MVTETTQFADTAFLLSAGDHVNKAASESQYAALLEHPQIPQLAMANVIGNHESGSAAFGQHFNAVNESVEFGVTEAGGDSWFRYQDTLFLLLNSNDLSTEEHTRFMEQVIAENPDAQWRIVALHHSLYTVANHAEDNKILRRRAELVPVLERLDVDVVLMGHDHVYCRTYIMDGLEPVTDTMAYDNDHYSAVTNPAGILYVTANSSTGSKTYDPKNQVYAYSAAQNQEHVPNVSKITVSDDSLTITTYRTTDLSVVDTFTINCRAVTPHPFTDVAETAWYADAVRFVYDQGCMNGISPTAFGPDLVTSRGMLATILYRMEGEPETGGNSFADVAAGRYYTDAVAWAAEAGIVRGYSRTSFGPEDPLPGSSW